MNIEISKLFFSYFNEEQVLNGIDLNILKGERVAIIGRNGSGKSTLVRHLAGLLKPSGGGVKIGDWKTDECSPAMLSQRVGFIFQNPDEQLCKTTVLKEVEFGVSLRGFSRTKCNDLVDRQMEFWGLKKYANVNPHDLSPSWRRRIIFASILAMDTPVVVLDEPTMGQDGRFKKQLIQLMAELKRQHKTVITISHDMDFVAELFERVLVLQKGKIALDGSPEEVFRENELLKSNDLISPQITRLGERLGLERTVCQVNDFIAGFEKDSSAITCIGTGYKNKQV